MRSVLVIADIAGQFDALMRLVALVPPDTLKVSLGDMVDRGKRSREVLEYFMAGYGVDTLALMGNHEHMMVDYLRGENATDYLGDCWVYNGGDETLKSFGNAVPRKVVEWIADLPLYMEFEAPGAPHKLFVSHAAFQRRIADLREDEELEDDEVFLTLWNRDVPFCQPGHFQVFGHNAHWGLQEFKVGELPYALCIDQSASRKLTGYLFPEGRVIEVPYDEEPPKEPAFEENSEEW